MVVSAKNGSMVADAGSGIGHMSDSLMAFQPAIEEPSNICPSEKVSSSIMVTSNVTCCHLPRGSVNRKSTYFTSLSLIIFMTFFRVVMECVPFRALVDASSHWLDFDRRLYASVAGPAVSDSVNSRFSGSDSD